MSENLESITIKECPKCKGTHQYSIVVERDFIMKMMTMADLHEEESTKKVTRLFNCPVNGGQFQARIVLRYTSSNPIKKVGGVVGND